MNPEDEKRYGGRGGEEENGKPDAEETLLGSEGFSEETLLAINAIACRRILILFGSFCLLLFFSACETTNPEVEAANTAFQGGSYEEALARYETLLAGELDLEERALALIETVRKFDPGAEIFAGARADVLEAREKSYREWVVSAYEQQSIQGLKELRQEALAEEPAVLCRSSTRSRAVLSQGRRKSPRQPSQIVGTRLFLCRQGGRTRSRQPGHF